MTISDGHQHKINALEAIDSAKEGQGSAETAAVAVYASLAVAESNLYLADTLFHLRDHIQDLASAVNRSTPGEG